MKMDGTESHKEFLKDFDHHEKVVRGPHEFVPFSAQTRMSGVNLPGMRIRKGSVDAIARFLEDQGSSDMNSGSAVDDDCSTLSWRS